MIKTIIDLQNYINKDDALLLSNRLKEKDLNYVNIFNNQNEIMEPLGTGIYLFISCFMEIKYIGYSKNMDNRIKKHNKYKTNDTIITIMTHSTFEGKSLETELLSLFRGRNKLRNKIQILKGRKR